MAHSTVRRKPRRMQRILALSLAGVVIGGGGAASAFMPGSPFAVEANAVSPANGMGGGYPGGNNSGFSLGNFNHNSAGFVYCLELGVTTLQGTHPTMSNSGTAPAYSFNGTKFVEGNTYSNISAPALSGDRIVQMNYILERWGQTSNNNQAAAVQLAIWELRRSGSSADYQRLLNDYRSTWGSIASTADGYIQQAQNNAGGGGGVDNPGDINVSWGDAYNGTVSLPAGTNSVTLTNAVFSDTGSATRTFSGGLGSRTSFNWDGVPPSGHWGDTYTVEVNGTYLHETSASQVRIGNPGGTNNQRLVTHAPTVSETRPLQGQAVDPSTVWSPVLTSEVPGLHVDKGENFADTIIFDVADDSNEWRWRATTGGDTQYAPITADGTLYGPFSYNPEDFPSATPPEDAPVAATASVTTSTSQGPGAYDVESDETAVDSGYYSWVWEIDFDQQDDGVQNPGDGFSPSLPENYYFTDGFGTVNETQLTRMDVEFSTALDRNEAAPGNLIDDVITPEISDEMFTTGPDGEIIPIHLTGTMYHMDEPQEQSYEIPEEAEVIGVYDVEITDPEQEVVAEDMQLPYIEGWITLVWEIDTDRSGELVEYFRDDFGVPSESALIAFPEVETLASDFVTVYDDAYDTAFVDGEVPNGTELTFELFARVDVGEPKFDEEGNVLYDEDGFVQRWTQEEIDEFLTDSGIVIGEPVLDEEGEPVLDEEGNPVLITEEHAAEAVCTASPIFNTRDNPIEVNEPGEYVSDGYRTVTGGTYYWVETLTWWPEDEDPEGEGEHFHVGECGIPNETTIVEEPTVTTQAQEDGVAGEPIIDTAIVDGVVPTDERIVTEVTFEVFVQDEDHEISIEDNVDVNAVCTADTLYAETDGVVVTEVGEYDSPEVPTEVGDAGIYYWIETLRWEDTETGETGIFQVGECGLQNERTDVVEPLAAMGDVASTGRSISPLLIGGLFALMITGAAITLIVRRRTVKNG